MHIKDYRDPRVDKPLGHVDEDALKHFVPADQGDSGHEQILARLRQGDPRAREAAHPPRHPGRDPRPGAAPQRRRPVRRLQRPRRHGRRPPRACAECSTTSASTTTSATSTTSKPPAGSRSSPARRPLPPPPRRARFSGWVGHANTASSFVPFAPLREIFPHFAPENRRQAIIFVHSMHHGMHKFFLLNLAAPSVRVDCGARGRAMVARRCGNRSLTTRQTLQCASPRTGPFRAPCNGEPATRCRRRLRADQPRRSAARKSRLVLQRSARV